jgi:hypothetical protein
MELPVPLALQAQLVRQVKMEQQVPLVQPALLDWMELREPQVLLDQTDKMERLAQRVQLVYQVLLVLQELAV